MAFEPQVVTSPGAPDSAGTLAPVQNRVLRNTYLLLALSLVPTIFGALLGVQLNFSLPGGTFIGLMLFLAIAFGFGYAIEKTKNSAWGVAILLSFTFFMGLMLSRLIARTLGFSNGGSLIALAFGGTAGIFFVMASVASTIKRDLSNMGKFLMIGLLLLFVALVANMFLQIPALHLTLVVLVIGIFSALLLYDINRIVTGGETNYITATLHIYLDIYNIFQGLLSLLGITSGD
jgi:FtsH-binding integral membrane protein